MSGTVQTFVGDGTNGTIEGAVYTQATASGGIGAPEIANGSIGPAKLTFAPATEAALAAHIGEVDAAHAASGILLATIDGLAADNVQDAIEELAAGGGGGGGGGSPWGGGVPTFVGEDQLWTVPVHTQAIAALPIQIAGTVVVHGTVVFLDL